MAGAKEAHTERRNPNPLTERTASELEGDVREFHRRQELGDVVDVELLVKGALISRDEIYIEICNLTEPERRALKSEAKLGFFQQTKELKVSILTTACAAIIQGWQQSTINASSRGWQCLFLLGDEPVNEEGLVKVTRYAMYITCLIDAAPWISGSIIGTWLSDPLQESIFGRRFALFISAMFCAACVLGTAQCQTWQQLLACRLILGIGIGAKASIAPVFAAEVAADHLRGRLLMMWQLFDTFGIFIGFLCYWIVGRSWRGLLGSAAVPALILLVLVFLCPESPRFLIRKSRYADAFRSLRQLRGSDIQAARDLYYIHSQLQMETELIDGKRPEEWWGKDLYQEKVKAQSFLQRVGALFRVRRNLRACVAAFLVMAAQQLCGINVLSFYSSTLFGSASSNSTGQNSVLDEFPSDAADVVNCKTPMNDTVAWLNFGFGLANFLFTIPAYKFIDHRGRRILLLLSLGGMFFTLLATSGFFRILTPDDARKGLVATFTIVVFTFFYGIGAGPVPFTFSAEVFPLAFREVGMSFSVMVNFLGLSILILFVPPLTNAFSPRNLGNRDSERLLGQSNLLFFFTGLNALAFILVFFLVPSGTAGISLEEMNSIFNTRTAVHAYNHLPGAVKRRWRPRIAQDQGQEGEVRNGYDMEPVDSHA
ncbi:MFS transporter [Aspergillus pseudoustus]|uniref:MFS transporter n=1 Tax=Aspergillus pseudoustus TaxID=1810923 RepID=A0ABR4JXN9_9EURO